MPDLLLTIIVEKWVMCNTSIDNKHALKQNNVHTRTFTNAIIGTKTLSAGQSG